MSTRNNFIYNSGKQLDISYNALNLPRTVDNGANGKMQFVYNAAGQKLRTTLYDSPSNITDTSDYIGNFIYKNGKLSYILMPEGRILPNGSGFAYEYHLKDQLGNTRDTYIAGANGNTTLTQTTAYYPFGLPINALSSNMESNPYLYNGKELHSELNLDLFDYGARFYDAEVGRFLQVDPLAEYHYNFTSYSYVYDNPMKYMDYFGLDTIPMSKAEMSDFDINKDVVLVPDVEVISPKSDRNTATISETKYNYFGLFNNYLNSESNNPVEGIGKFVGRVFYGTANDLFVLLTSFAAIQDVSGLGEVRNLDGSYPKPKDKLDAGINGIITLIPYATNTKSLFKMEKSYSSWIFKDKGSVFYKKGNTSQKIKEFQKLR